MTQVYPSFDGRFQQEIHRITKLKSNYFFEDDTLLKWPPQSPELIPIEHLWDLVEILDVQPTNLKHLCDAIVSIWSKISEECFQDLDKASTKYSAGTKGT